MKLALARSASRISGMHGPQLLVRTLGKPVSFGKSREKWQYHSRSDRHSKVACWGILLDLLLSSNLLRSQVAAGTVAFGINHEMKDFRQDRKKDLDLVLCKPSARTSNRKRQSFRSLAGKWGIELDAAAESALAGLPDLFEAPVASTLVAVEAKACMTAHVKALPRLFDELNSSHLTVHGDTESTIAAGVVMVNAGEEFISPGRVGYCPNCSHRVSPVNVHRQPADTLRVMEKMKQLPRRASVKEEGFDAFAIVTIDCRNDGGPVELVESSPALPASDSFHYDQMINRLAQVYENRYGDI